MHILLQALTSVGLSIFNKIIREHGEEFFTWLLFKVAHILVDRTDTPYDNELVDKLEEFMNKGK